jgi:hypothetical protein
LFHFRFCFSAYCDPDKDLGISGGGGNVPVMESPKPDKEYSKNRYDVKCQDPDKFYPVPEKVECLLSGKFDTKVECFSK